jgi:hypothetical protein
LEIKSVFALIPLSFFLVIIFICDVVQVYRMLLGLKEKAHPVNKRVVLKGAKEPEVQGQSFQRYCINIKFLTVKDLYC